MGRLFVMEHIGNDAYFYCIRCNTYIAKQRHQYDLPRGEAEPYVRGFTQVVNVLVGEASDYYEIGSHTFADIYCIQCGHKLGCQYIKVRGWDPHEDGRVKLRMQNLGIRPQVPQEP
ncbi:hypothetical protein ACP275_04G191300 [Erythranthe tilingii]